MGRLTVGERLDALARAVRAGGDVLPLGLREHVAAIEERAGHRLRLSGDHTVVALAGATGSGKSSVLNVLVGHEVAGVGVLRPTTSQALAVVRGEEGSTELLDWLAVDRRHHTTADEGAAVESGLILLDLPDHDSVRLEHRLEAERLVALVDLMVWVVDPQKYADAALHERYLRGLAGHREVLLVALNQVDRLDPADRGAVHRDLVRLLEGDGLEGVPVLDLSARTGEGVDALRTALSQAARRRQAARARTEADVIAAAGQVLDHCGGNPSSLPDPGPLVTSLERAAGVPVVVDAVRRARVTRARQATGWPPTRWLARLRPDPLRRLHLVDEPDPEVARSSLPRTGPAEAARARGSVRSYVDALTDGAPDAWVLAARDAVDTTTLPGALDHAVASTSLDVAHRPAWWFAVGALQWALLAVTLGGIAWWVALWAAHALRVPLPEPPTWGPFPWPTVLVLGGAVLGLALAGVARLGATLGARRLARRARARLRDAVAEVAERVVVEPARGVVERRRICQQQASRAASGRRRREPDT